MSDEMSGDATLQAVLQAVSQIGGQVAALNTTVDRYASKVDDVRDRVIKIEARDPRDQIKELTARIDAVVSDVDSLKGDRNKVIGAGTAASLIKEWAPFIVALLAVALIYLKK